MSRLLRLLRTRWWIVLLLALVNAWIAGSLTDLRNEELPELEAIAAVTYVPRLGEVDDEPVLTRLQEDTDGALEANEEELGERNGLFGWEVAAIETDERDYRLLFIGRADDPSDAEEIAGELRENFISAGYLEEARLGELDTQLDLILAELGVLRERIDEATAQEPVDPEVELQRLLLSAEMDALRGRYAGLTSQRLAPPSEDRTLESIDEEIASIRVRLSELQTEFALLPSPPEEITEDAPPEESLPTTIDRLQYEQLQGVYQELFIRRLEAQSGGGVQPIVLQPTALEPTPKGLNQAIGGLVGVAAALFGLVLAERARNPVWPAVEVGGITVLEVIPPRPLFISGARPWYLRNPAGERKSGIQRLRSVVEVLENDKGATIGISGVSVPAQDVHELAADLAVSLAVSGRRTLLVDANLKAPSHLVEFGPGQITLPRLLRGLVNADENMRNEVETMLDRSTETVPNLRGLSAGEHQLDAADLLSRPEFGVLLESAREMFDMIVVSCAPASEASAHVLFQRLQAVILMGTAGQTTTDSVVGIGRSLADRRAHLLGLVLMSRPLGLLRRGRRFLESRAYRRSRRPAAIRGTPTQHPQPRWRPLLDRFSRNSSSRTSPEDGAGESGTHKQDSATRS